MCPDLQNSVKAIPKFDIYSLITILVEIKFGIQRSNFSTLEKYLRKIYDNYIVNYRS